MDITLRNISKRFNREYIFKNLNYQFKSDACYAITGSNGSGKSTLIQVLSGYVRPSSGEISYNGTTTAIEDLYNDISITTPYMELIEEFTLSELIDFHFKFKTPTITKSEIIKIAYLETARHKQVKNFSSGMKQRLKLALALFSDTTTLLLDEPTSNLDAQGIGWYKEQMMEITKNHNKLLIIASNQLHEYDFCTELLNIEDYK